MPSTTTRYGLPYPSAGDAPDGPAAVFNLATAVEALLDRRIAVQLNGPRSLTANAWTDIPYDTNLSVPTASMLQGDGVGIALPWTGRYSILGRAGVNGGDIAATATVGIRAYRPSDGYIWSEVGQYGIRGDEPMMLADEITATAGQVLRFTFWVTVTGRQFSYGSDPARVRLAARYLGPV